MALFTFYEKSQWHLNFEKREKERIFSIQQQQHILMVFQAANYRVEIITHTRVKIVRVFRIFCGFCNISHESIQGDFYISQ